MKGLDLRKFYNGGPPVENSFILSPNYPRDNLNGLGPILQTFLRS
jgi:hypothetical protein